MENQNDIMELKVVCLICKKQIFNNRLSDEDTKKPLTELLKSQGKYVIIKNKETDEKVGGFLCEKCYKKLFESI